MLNEFSIQLGLFTRVNITRQHGIYAGISPLWALELYTFTPKYGNKNTKTKRGTALALTAGYNFKFKGKLSLFMELEFDHFITENLIDSIVPTAGITIGL